MDVQHLSEADLHLVYGLLLKKKRSPAQQRKVLSIVRSEMALPARIEAIVRISRVQVLVSEATGRWPRGWRGARRSGRRRGKERQVASSSTPARRSRGY